MRTYVYVRGEISPKKVLQLPLPKNDPGTLAFYPLQNQMPHKYTFCILKVYTNFTLMPSGLFGVYFLYTLNK